MDYKIYGDFQFWVILWLLLKMVQKFRISQYPILIIVAKEQWLAFLLYSVILITH